MTYEEIIRQAEVKCDEWFIETPTYFLDKARLIVKRCKAWFKEDAKLNPPKNRDQKRKGPSLVNPIIVCFGKAKTEWNPLTHCNENRTETLIPSNKDDALLVYVALLLILHDGAAIKGAGYEIITKDIWPEDWLKGTTELFFDPHGNDRSVFIETALRHVQKDLASKSNNDLAGDDTDPTLTDPELTLLTDLAANEGLARCRAAIKVATNLSDSTLKNKLLPRFEKLGLVSRPKGEREGYTITNKGSRLFKKLSPCPPKS